MTHRSLAALVALACLAFAAISNAQPAHDPMAGGSDIPAGPAAIRGRIVHASSPELAQGIQIVLYALAATGETGLRTTETGIDGVFTFESVSNDPGTVYLVGARYGEIPFGTKFSFEADQLLHTLELTVSDPSADAADVAEVRIGESELYFDRSCEQLRVREALNVRNPTDKVILIPKELRGSRTPLFELALPAGASGFSSALGDLLSGLDEAGGTVRFWGPLHPGSQEIEFSYALPDTGEPTRVRRTLGRGASGVAAILPRSWPAPSSAAEGESPEFSAEVARYPILRDAAPGSTLLFDLEAPPRGEASGAASFLESQIWIELDDAALTVNEHHLFEMDESAPQQSTGEPLLCISLPEGAESLRFSNQTLALGISPDPSGALAVHGPLPPGPRNGNSVSFRYQQSVQSEPIRFERKFDQRVPLLTVLIADTHLLVETDRLHRRRSTQSGERSYIHLEAFEIGAGETVPLELTRLVVAAPLPRWAVGGILAAATAGALVFLISPLQIRRSGASADLAGDAAATAAERAADERENIYAAIDDLDHDLETSKVTADDHAIMRADLLAKAVGLVRAERSAQAAPAPSDEETQDAKFCTSCGVAVSTGDRFCSQCGSAIPRTSSTG